MKKLALIIGLAGVIHSLSAQTTSPSSRKTFFSDLRLELPMLETKAGFTINDKSLLSLPYGMNDLLYPTKPYYSFVWTSFRWIAVYYKDKFGLEFYSDDFSTSLNPDKFNNNLKNRFPGYYFSPGWILSDFEFGGQAIGISYRMHWKGLILEPKFLIGNESLRNDSSLYSAYLKQMGSNQFVEYNIGRFETTPHQRSYQGRFLIGKRWEKRNKPTGYEIGCQFEYIYSPYTARMDITQRSYGQPVIEDQLTIKTSARVVNAGLYFKIYPHRWIY